jgi:hypothetical protein
VTACCRASVSNPLAGNWGAGTMSCMRRRTDRLYRRTLGPRELQALQLVADRPGITIAELAEALDVPMNRIWQIVGWLENARVRRERNDVDA